MNLLAEISMYPLRDDYLEQVDAFLELLNAQDAVEVKTNRMSTQLYGEYDVVLDVLREAMRIAHENDCEAAYVCKFIPGAPRSIGGYE